jgi:hypothetical protein
MVFMFLLSCSHKDTKNITDSGTKEIKVNLYAEKKKSFDFFTFNSFIALETNDESLIQEIKKIAFNNDKIYILDAKQKCIFVFDRTGKYLFKIDRHGESSVEYLSSSDFFIDNRDSMLYILDGTSGKILQTDLTGNFINRFDVEKGYSFTKLPNNQWLMFMGNAGASRDNKIFNNIFIFDKNFKVLREFLPINNYMIGLKYTYGTVNSSISVYDGKTFVLPFLSNFIYTYDGANEILHTEYEIVFGNNSYPQIEEKTNDAEVKSILKRMQAGDIPSRVSNFIKINHIILFKYSYEDGIPLCLYNENTLKTELINSDFDDTGLLFTAPVVYFSDKKIDKVLCILDSYHFGICKSKNKDSPVIKEMDDAIGGIEDPNPILVFYDMKNM